MSITFAIMFFLVGALTNEIWRSILEIGFTVRICRETVYQTFKVAKTFADHIEIILAYQYKVMKKAGMRDEEIEDAVNISASSLSIWKQSLFDAVMAEVPVLVKDHFKQKGYTSFDSISKSKENSLTP